ncbi:hypothetical protein [Hansschlegelia plantiphila]|uniref:hypothetical protein n=1 Tax=Hansschlegelia plantiphila TaxID=374655 RepID=UPI0022F27230|nr:hypothetical protein [Hansschlegelia plantiphila]
MGDRDLAGGVSVRFVSDAEGCAMDDLIIEIRDELSAALERIAAREGCDAGETADGAVEETPAERP